MVEPEILQRNQAAQPLCAYGFLQAVSLESQEWNGGIFLSGWLALSQPLSVLSMYLLHGMEGGDRLPFSPSFHRHIPGPGHPPSCYSAVCDSGNVSSETPLPHFGPLFQTSLQYQNE